MVVVGVVVAVAVAVVVWVVVGVVVAVAVGVVVWVGVVVAVGGREMTIDHDAIAARVEYASDLIDPLVTLAADMERHAVEEWDESDFIIKVADTLRALITYRERLEKAESALHDEVKRLRATGEIDRKFARKTADDVVSWKSRAEKAEAERDALRAHPYLPAEEIAAIERGNRRWHGEYDTTVSVRWEPYKPDGQRQMKAKGRWQTMTYNGSGYFRWENCNRPAHVRAALKGDSDE